MIGAGESGKSTIIKQMRIIHSGGFPDDERHQTRAVIYANLIIAFKVLLDIMNAEHINFEHDSTRVSRTEQQNPFALADSFLVIGPARRGHRS